jgi:ribonuclease-3 family protein
MDVEKKSFPDSTLFSLIQTWDESEIRKIPARTLAYIGDAVYELGLRLEHVRLGIDKAGRLHDSLVAYVSSSAQARVFDVIFPGLSEPERQLVVSWRNAKTPSRYGSGTRAEYARATALEAWVAYLFLTRQTERLKELFAAAISNYHNEIQD